MSKKNILLAITNGAWLIDVNSAQELGSNVAALLSGKSFWDVEHKSKPEVLVIEDNNAGAFYSSNVSSAKPGSIAVVHISGPIMKEDNCGDPGTKTYESIIKQAAANPNIKGIILQIDSPGGTVAGTESLANTVASVGKPVVTLAEDLMASAAYWIGSKANYIFANTETTRVGSVGTMLSFADMQPYWEKQGVKFHEIYATKSTAKNADFAEARKGNYDNLIKNTLDPLNNVFLNSVKEARGTKLNAEKTLNGQVYTAADAIKYGLIDAVGNMQNAVDKINEMAYDASEQPTQENHTMKKITLTAAHAALLALFGASIKQGENSVDVELNDENIAKLNASVEELSTVKTDLDKAKADLATATDKVKAVEQEFEAFKKDNPGSTTLEKQESDTIEESSANTCEMDERLKEDLKKAGL